MTSKDENTTPTPRIRNQVIGNMLWQLREKSIWGSKALQSAHSYKEET